MKYSYSLAVFMSLILTIQGVFTTDITTVFIPFSQYISTMMVNIPTVTVTSIKTVDPSTITITTAISNTPENRLKYKTFYEDTTTITIPTNTLTFSKTLRLQAETQTIKVTVNTVPITTEASLLFCYNLI